MPEKIPSQPTTFTNIPKKTSNRKSWKSKKNSRTKLSVLNKLGFRMHRIYQSKLNSVRIKLKRGKPNKESELMIMWMKMILKDDATYKKIVKEIMKDTERLLDVKNKDQVISLLEKRFHNASMEYGSPEKDKNKIDREIMFEQLDLLGWRIVGLFSQERNV